MLEIIKLFLLINIQIIIIQCIIPSLSVRKVDQKVIERKRQDTLEMCRIFTAETERLNKLKPSKPFASKKRRVKRDLEPAATFVANPGLNAEDANRVENIVDKLYDDMEENGTRVTYRHRDLSTTTPKAEEDRSGRRLNFAPAMLLGPEDAEPNRSFVDLGPAEGIPWIKKWKHGIVPFFIDSKTYDTHLSDVIIKAFDYFEKATCIRLQKLRERPTDKQSLQKVEWVYITNPYGIRQCVHSNERKPNKGVQMVVFGYDCMSRGEIIHEIMHVLGFSHEHTRPDRDQHISIMWDSIKPGYKKYFEMRAEDPLMDMPYDYDSVLHYPPRAFSRNGKITVYAERALKLGQREGLSVTDIAKVNTIFGQQCELRNKEYLLTTCPSTLTPAETVSADGLNLTGYFHDRLWPFGVVNYKLKDKMEFSAEERQNIEAVINHIEKETCIEFRNIQEEDEENTEGTNSDPQHKQTPDKNSSDGERSQKSGSDAEVKNHSDVDYSPQNTSDSEVKSSNEILDKKRTLSENKVPSSEKKGSIEKTETIKIGKYASAHTGDNKSDEPPNSLDVDAPTVVTNSIKEMKDDGEDTEDENKLYESLEKPSRIVRSKRTRRAVKVPLSPHRRHATSALILKRSAQPGCKCPKPGLPDGDQILEINMDCFNSVNDLLHLFVHVLGLDHQHNMHDRDSFLHIDWDKLTPEIRNELKTKLPIEASLGLPYDYQSVMHYPWLQIKDGVTNIMYPIWNDGWAMGHWQGLSWTDVRKINILYSGSCLKRKIAAEEE